MAKKILKWEKPPSSFYVSGDETYTASICGMKAEMNNSVINARLNGVWTLTCDELGIKNMGLIGDFKASKKDAEGYIKDKLKTRIKHYEKVLSSM